MRGRAGTARHVHEDRFKRAQNCGPQPPYDEAARRRGAHGGTELSQCSMRARTAAGSLPARRTATLATTGRGPRATGGAGCGCSLGRLFQVPPLRVWPGGSAGAAFWAPILACRRVRRYGTRHTLRHSTAATDSYSPDLVHNAPKICACLALRPCSRRP